MPPTPDDGVDTTDTRHQLRKARETILTALLRVSALAGSIAFLITINLILELEQPILLVAYLIANVVIWYVAIRRKLPYWLRGGLVLALAYTLALIDLISFGFSEDTISYLAAFSLFGMIFFGGGAGAITLLLSTGTLVCAGVALSIGGFVPLVNPLKELAITPMVVTSVIFLATMGAVQSGVAVLLHSLEHALQNDRDLRLALDSERGILAQRIIERTYELAAARDEAHAMSQRLATQNQYLESLHRTTVDLLDRHMLDELLQKVVERATAILNAPYGVLALIEHDELVVYACTDNQPFMQQARIGRDAAPLWWQACDTMQAVTTEEYMRSSQRLRLFDALQLCAEANFPLILGQRSMGVLTLGRVSPGHYFTAEQSAQGMLFSQLAAVMLDNAQLHTTARSEIDKRQRAYVALQATAEALQTQNDELDAFAHTVAHDIKSPLTAMVGYAHLLQITLQSLENAEIDEYLSKISANGYKLSSIVEALLLLASTSIDNQVPLMPLQMNSILSDLPQRLQELTSKRPVQMRMPESWPVAMGYAPWVEEIWVNYVSNAVKYGGDGLVITLGADEAVDGYVRFWVRDSGPGLSEEQQARLFTPFTRLHKDRAPGHGLGLSIVRRIVDRLGGEVGVESSPGQGSTFYFTLPTDSTILAAYASEITSSAR
ncbi:GAF domain-containing protein [Candidatus Gracilibacteria bacterium]|nr:GAF domain-containing protein [Candidatus Gracilibacteria bacterium]